MGRVPSPRDLGTSRDIRTVGHAAVPAVIVLLWTFAPGVAIYIIGWSFGRWYKVPVGIFVIACTAYVGGLMIVVGLMLVAHWVKSKSGSRRR
jgi:hypothetical protein